jgi:MOSC domain-containing protein YiiM
MTSTPPNSLGAADPMACPPRVQLLSVNVAMPAYLGEHLGASVSSGFKKQPVRSADIRVDPLDLAGDGQADLIAHGGPEKAVYAYSANRYDDWRRAAPELSEIPPAYFGENLTVAGLTEPEVRIGDVWAWGSARLEVCQPRWPCYKFGLASGRPDFLAVMLRHGWTGWYFRVLTPGVAPVTGPIEVIERGPAGATVFDAHAARLPRAETSLIRQVAAAPALASRWRAALEEELARRG